MLNGAKISYHVLNLKPCYRYDLLNKGYLIIAVPETTLHYSLNILWKQDEYLTTLSLRYYLSLLHWKYRTSSLNLIWTVI